MSLRPPSASGSRSPSPGAHDPVKAGHRQSMGPGKAPTNLAPISPRPAGGRPTSELYNTPTMFQTPEAEAIDQWFENLQNYEATLEDMAAASLDVNFKEELSAIEQWFKVLSEAERTAALYSLLQHSTQVQIRFFITVLQQMARADPMTALLSPAMGGSMQSQMEAKLATLKSPGANSKLPASPTTRNFSTKRQSLVLDNPSNFLSPDSANSPPSSQDTAAATLAQQRAKLNASNAAHRISAPVLSLSGNGLSPDGGRGVSGNWATHLGQVAEQNAPPQELVINASRPKSTEFSGTLGSPRPEAMLSPAINDSWASMVNTPAIPLFPKNPQPLDAAANKLSDWSKSAASSVPRMGDPTIHRRQSKAGDPQRNSMGDKSSIGVGIYGDDGNLMQQGQQNGGLPQQNQNQARTGVGMRNNNANNTGGLAPGSWNGARSPALSNVSSNRFGGSDDGSMSGMSALGMQMPNVGGFNLGMGGMTSPGLGMGMPMAPISPFNINMQLAAMGISPEAQLLAAQMAASGFGGQPGQWMGMQGQQAGMNNNNRRGGGGTGNNNRNTASKTNAGTNGPKGEDDVDPALLGDIPAWLRSLRLHKYTPNFEGCKWQDMVTMDEAALEAKGVAALGARRKMLKTFELVRKKMGIPEPDNSASASEAA